MSFLKKICSYLQQYCTIKWQLPCQNSSVQNTSEPGKLQYKCYIRWVQEHVSDESVYTQISALYTGVPDEFGYSNEWSQDLDTELRRASQVWNCLIQVVKLLRRELKRLPAGHAVWSRTEATSAGLESHVNISLHTQVCEVHTHRHQAESAGMTDHLQ